MRRKIAFRAGIALAVLGSLMVLWMNLAVGIIGTPDHPANLMYVAVLAVGIVGALVSRFRARGMVRAMAAMVVAQLLVAAVTLVSGVGYPPTPAFSYLVLNTILVAFWGVAAWLFYRASDEQDVDGQLPAAATGRDRRGPARLP